MPLLSEKDTKYLKKTFEEHLKDAVKVLVFVDDPSECEYCDLTKQVLEELSSIDGKIQLSTHHVKKEPELVTNYKVEMTPAIILLDANGEDTNIRFYGIPSGHEFSTLIQDIIAVSNNKPSLLQRTADRTDQVDKRAREDQSLRHTDLPILPQSCPHGAQRGPDKQKHNC